MTTQLQIGQMALAEIGTRSTVTATGPTPNGTIFGDGSEEALYLDMYYGPVRDHALRAARWNFAKHVDTVTLYKALPGTPENPTPPATQGWQRTYPTPPWLYSYVLPADFVYGRAVIAQPNISTLSPPLFPISGSTIAMPRSLRAPFEISVDGYSTSGSPVSPQVKVLLTNEQTPLFEYTYESNNEALWDTEFVMTMVLALAGRLAVALTSDKQMAQMKLDSANQLILGTRVANANEGVTILDHMPDWLSIRGVGVATSTLFFDFYYPYGPLFTMAPYI